MSRPNAMNRPNVWTLGNLLPSQCTLDEKTIVQMCATSMDERRKQMTDGWEKRWWTGFKKWEELGCGCLL